LNGKEDYMNLREFLRKADEIIDEMDVEELKCCLHNMARRTPEKQRESFLLSLEDSFVQVYQKGSGAKRTY
jgi:thioester reductase-like protein